MYSLRMSFCSVPPSLRAVDPALLRRRDVHPPDQRRRRVDRHRGRDLVERQFGQQQLHIGQRGDAHPALAELSRRQRIVVVVAHQRGHVEGDAQPRLPVVEQAAEAHVGLLRAAEAREHPDRPRPPAIAGRMHAARVRVLARQTQVALHIPARVLQRRRVVQPLNRPRRDRHKRPRPLPTLRLHPSVPLRPLAPQSRDRVAVEHSTPPSPSDPKCIGTCSPIPRTPDGLTVEPQPRWS